MLYTVGDFVHNLAQRQGIDQLNIQSDDALEMLNECLPRNMMAKKLFKEEPEEESISDIP
jgi:hypothetical protein